MRSLPVRAGGARAALRAAASACVALAAVAAATGAPAQPRPRAQDDGAAFGDCRAVPPRPELERIVVCGLAAMAQRDAGPEHGPELDGWLAWWLLRRDGELARLRRERGLDGDRAEVAAELERAAIPALLESLAVPCDAELGREAALSLALCTAAIERCDPGGGAAGYAAPTLRRLVRSRGDHGLRATAALGLGLAGEREDLGELASLLRDRRAPEAVRSGAAAGLALLAARDPALAPDAARLLAAGARERGAPPQVAATCAAGLGVVPVVDGAHDVTGCGGRVSLLLGVLEDPGACRLVRAQAPTALARLLAGAPADSRLRGEVVARLAAALRVADDELERETEALALGRLGRAEWDAEVVDVLLDLARAEGERFAGGYAQLALAEIAVRADAEPRRRIASFLEQVAERAAWGARPWAQLALGELAGGLAARGEAGELAQEIRELLHGLLTGRRDGELSSTQQQLFHALARAGDPRAVTVLRRAAKRPPVGTLIRIADGLAMAGDPAAIPALRELVWGRRWGPEPVASCTVALSLLGDVEIEDELVRKLREPSAGYRAMLYAAALGELGGAASIGPLADAALDEWCDLRAAAVRALGEIADRGERWYAPFADGASPRALPLALADRIDEPLQWMEGELARARAAW